MRYLSLHLAFLATDRIGRRLKAAAQHKTLALGEDQVPRVTTAKIKSAVRLVSLNESAFALGLSIGMPLADVRAMYPRLDVHDADPTGDIATRDALVDWCGQFTPFAAPDGDDGIMLDITGAANLFGGEIAMMETIVRRLQAQGFAANAAVAGASATAWALARFSKNRRYIAEDIDADAYAKIFASMRLAALRLEAKTITQLGQAGLHSIGDLLIRPRAPIAARFGSHIHHRLDCLLGLAKEPISPRFETPPLVAERRFAEGIARIEEIEATILALSHDLCSLLSRHGEGARRLSVALYRVDGVVKHLDAGTSHPLRDPQTMARLFHERIAAVGEDGLDTGYGFEVIQLAALMVERLDPSQTGWDTEDADEAALADLIDRLGNRFGFGRVTRLVPVDTHCPERAAVALPAGEKSKRPPPPSPVEHDAKALPERPLRLFDHPEPIEAIAEVPDRPPLRFRWRRVIHHIAAIEGPERIGPDWWKPGQDEASRTRDYFRVEDTEGRRFWLYREGLYYCGVEPRWFLHGLFA